MPQTAGLYENTNKYIRRTQLYFVTGQRAKCFVLFFTTKPSPDSTIIIHLLTKPMEQISSTEANRFSASQEMSTFYPTRRTKARHLSLSWARSIHSTLPPITLPEDVPNLVPFPLLRSYQNICPCPRHLFPFRNKVSFYGEELLAPRPVPNLEDHPF